jgi:type IX secretion system PorP/SprF family membrane protein
MKKIIIIAILLNLVLVAKAQQLPMYSQYFFNEYAYNPALAGTADYVDVRSSHRYQWVGLTDAPRTYTLSVYGPTKNKKMGLGGFLFTDHVGPTRRTGLQFSYSYIFKINKDIKLSMALSGGLLEWKLDAHKINLYSSADQVLVNSVMRTIVPDATFGTYLYHDKWYVGASAPNILQSKLKFDNALNTGRSKLSSHYYVHGGYRFDLGEDFQLEPSLIVKYVNPAPVQADVMLRMIWKKQLWIGGAYRTMDAASLMMGYTHRENLSFGYSYDITTSNLQNYSTGTHEIMLAVRFVREKSFDSKEIKPSIE